MEWLYPIALRVIAAIALIYFGLGLFNVHWLLRVRIIAALSVGGLIVGAAGYPLVRPDDPLGAISLFTQQTSLVDGAVLILLGFVAGAVATAVCYPVGSAVAPIAAPGGAAVLAVSGGSLRQLLLTHSAFEQRNALYASLRWELLFWVGICAAGYLGVQLASKLLKTGPIPIETQSKLDKKPASYLNWTLAAGAAAFIVYLTIGIFVQDIRQIDTRFDSVVGHPGPRQIAFGVFVSVGLAGFAAKQFIQVHFIPVILGASALYLGVFTRFIGSEDLQYMVSRHPIDFFPKSIYAILPVQFGAFAALGAIAGYWIAIYLKNRPEHPA